MTGVVAGRALISPSVRSANRGVSFLVSHQDSSVTVRRPETTSCRGGRSGAQPASDRDHPTVVTSRPAR